MYDNNSAAMSYGIIKRELDGSIYHPALLYCLFKTMLFKYIKSFYADITNKKYN